MAACGAASHTRPAPEPPRLACAPAAPAPPPMPAIADDEPPALAMAMKAQVAACACDTPWCAYQIERDRAEWEMERQREIAHSLRGQDDLDRFDAYKRVVRDCRQRLYAAATPADRKPLDDEAARAVEALDARVVALCACQDRACGESAFTAMMRTAMLYEAMPFAPEHLRQLEALQPRARACAATWMSPP